MTRPTMVHQAATAQNGRPGTPGGVPAPYLVLDLGPGLDPHQARCRRCRWRVTAAQAQGEYGRHQLAAHALGRRRARRGHRGRLARWVR